MFDELILENFWETLVIPDDESSAVESLDVENDSSGEF